MAAITTRQTAGTGATVAGIPLTNAQLDTNFINLNVDVLNRVSKSGDTLTGTFGVKSVQNFISPNATKTISATMLDSGQLSWSGSAGQLFSITDSLTGTLFSVNDVSGIPSIEVLDTGLVKIAQYGGNTLFGTGVDNAADKVQVVGTASIVANSTGTALRITQTGTGDALRVEDSANPDSTPFVVSTDGSVGIGITSLTGYSLYINKDPTGAISTYGLRNGGTIQSDVTTQHNVFYSRPATAAAAFTLSNLTHFRATQGTIGANSAITSQYGFIVDSDLTGATNNYGFYTSITSGTNRWNFYAAGSADNYFAGSMGIGAVPSNAPWAKVTVGGLYPSGNNLSLANYAIGTVPSTSTTEGVGYWSELSTQAASFSTSISHFVANQGALGAGSTVTTQHGFRVSSNLIGAANNFGVVSNIPDGVTRTVTTVARTTNVVTITTSVAHGYTIGQSVLVAAGTNTGVNGTFTITSIPTTTTFTYSQTGIDIVSVADTGSAKIAGRWNFYAAGTADNYFAGKIGIGTTTPGESLDVRGNLRVGGADAGPNYIAFRGTTGELPGSYNHTYIGERIYAPTENSELVLFKGNDQSGGSGPDRIRLAAANIVFDTYVSPVSGTFEQAATSANLITRAIITDIGNFGIGITAPSRLLHLQQTNAATNTVTRLLRLDNYSTGTPANGIGTGIEFAVETTDNNLEIGAAIDAVVTDVTAGSEDFDLVFRTMNAGVAVTEKVRIDSVGNVGIGDSSPSTRGRLSVLATTGVGRQFVVTSAGLAQIRYDDNSLPSALTLQNHGMSGANQGAAIQWTLGNSDANSQNAAAIRVTAEGTWDATTASRDSAMAFFTTLDGNMGERMRIDSAGRVGLGTAIVDSAKSGVIHLSNLTSEIRVESTDNTTGTANSLINLKGFAARERSIYFTDTSNTEVASIGLFYNSGSPSTSLAIKTAGIERIKIDNAGRVGFGASPYAGTQYYFANSITGATSVDAILQAGTVQSGVTSTANIFTSFTGTAASAFTLSNLRHFVAEQATFGVGSTVTNQYGYQAGASLIGATNNYGFLSNIASGTGRWNFYAQGTAANYFAGTVTIAATTSSTSTTTGALIVAGGVGIAGALNATTKSFIINHPTKPGKLLRHGSLEGPEFGVYVRGRLDNNNMIVLPEYWAKLVDPGTITVNLTPIGSHQELYVENIVNNVVFVKSSNLFNKTINCFYTVFGERVDVDKLEVET